MHLKPEDTIIVTNNRAMVDYLERDHDIHGIVKGRVTADEVKGKHVIGEIPAIAAKNAFCVTSINYKRPVKHYGETYKDIKEAEPELFTYVVVPIVATDPTDY